MSAIDCEGLRPSSPWRKAVPKVTGVRVLATLTLLALFQQVDNHLLTQSHESVPTFCTQLP